MIDRALRQFDDAIKLKRYEENAELWEKRDRVLRRLQANLKTPFTPFNQGSYAMGTGVKPVGGRDYDIDVGIELHCKEYELDPLQAKEDVYRAVADHTARVEFRRNCITVFYHRAGEVRFHVDLAVYAQSAFWNEGLKLAVGKRHSGHSSWQDSDPRGLIEAINRHSGEAGAQFRRIVRYLKRWKDENFSAEGNAAPTGIALTASVLQHYPTSMYGTMGDAWALESVINGMLGSGWRVSAKLPLPPGNDLFQAMTVQQMEEFKARLQQLQDALVRADIAKLRRLLGADFRG